MTILLTQNRVQWTIRHAHKFIVAGVSILLLSLLLGSIGIITGGMLIGLGACPLALSSWNRERGLWMLSVVFIALFLPTYVGFLIGEVSDLVHGRASSLLIAIDVSGGTSALGFLVRFLITVAAWNRKLSLNAEQKTHPSPSETDT